MKLGEEVVLQVSRRQIKRIRLPLPYSVYQACGFTSLISPCSNFRQPHVADTGRLGLADAALVGCSLCFSEMMAVLVCTLAHDSMRILIPRHRSCVMPRLLWTGVFRQSMLVDMCLIRVGRRVWAGVSGLAHADRAPQVRHPHLLPPR
eukprot:1108737-Rhodomonas_salina.2